MQDKPITSFRPIAAPLDVDDAALDRLNTKLGVPTMTKPVANKKQDRNEKPAAFAPSDAEAVPAPLEKLTIELPDYLADAVRRAGLDRKSSARHIVMVALQKNGFEIAAVDLVADGRRARRKVQ